MAIERARTQAVPRPWGVAKLEPWHTTDAGGAAIGEIWFERSGKADADPALLLKLLFTSQPLSIQVHPDDAYALSIGQPNGKTEAWYVLHAAPGAKVALGLKKQITKTQLRRAIEEGSIAALIAWQAVSKGELISVPAGTIHAIGAGLVIAEIQQRSDATFRLFDFGRQRELHIADALAVAATGPAEAQVRQSRLSDQRTLLVSNPHFVFERIELPPHASWSLDAERETWLLAVGGGARTGSFDLAQGDALFAEADHVEIRTGSKGLVALAAYAAAGPAPHLLERLGQPSSARAETRLGQQP